MCPIGHSGAHGSRVQTLLEWRLAAIDSMVGCGDNAYRVRHQEERDRMQSGISDLRTKRTTNVYAWKPFVERYALLGIAQGSFPCPTTSGQRRRSPPAVVRRQRAMVARQADTRPRYQGRKPGHKVERLEDQVCGPVAAGVSSKYTTFPCVFTGRQFTAASMRWLPRRRAMTANRSRSSRVLRSGTEWGVPICIATSNFPCARCPSSLPGA